MTSRGKRGPWAGTCCIVAALAALAGCGESVSSLLGSNQPPELEIVSASPDRSGPGSVRVRWAARDPDGRVVRSQWSRSPWRAGREQAQVTSTQANECLLTARPRTDPAALASRAAVEPDLFQVWAVDDRGAASPRAKLALFGCNVAPTVTITSPQPSQFISQNVASEFCAAWTGIDPDGVFTQQPVKYKYTLLTNETPITIQMAKADPDTIWRYYAPTGWAGWDSTSCDTTFASNQGLEQGSRYMFVITAFDEAGDYDPVFHRSKNMLDMTIVPRETAGPRIRMTGTNFDYQYESGGWADHPLRTVSLEIPSDTPTSYSFSALPYTGHAITGYRWVLDPSSPQDQTPRSDEATDLGHWSAWSPDLGSLTLPAFTGPGFKRSAHKLYIEAASSPSPCTPRTSDFVSLGILKLVVVHPTASRELLIVDDTRLEPDRFIGGTCPTSYASAWPSAAELDTFLYARGGVPWRCTLQPPTGVESPPGVFAGYDFDTLGTRGLWSGLQQFGEQSQTVPLSLLADYRHVIWITDGYSAQLIASLDQSLDPTTSLYKMNGPGRVNVLSAYVSMGGKLWLVGGGTAMALMKNWDRPQNNSGGITRFSGAQPFDELGPARMPWEQLHLRSELSVTQGAVATRSLGRFTSQPGNYADLPAALQSKTAGTDPLPPTRLTGQANLFYSANHYVEYLSQPNSILEDVDPDPGAVDERSTLDTLFQVTGSTIPVTTFTNAAMTLYHGPGQVPIVWTGFDIWTWQRAQCIALVDWVLLGHWGLARAPVARLESGGAGSAPRSSQEPRTRTLAAPRSARAQRVR